MNESIVRGLASGFVAIGSSASQTFTATDAGTRQTGVLQDSITGPDAAEFAITSDKCAGRRLKGGESCAITVVFAPTVAGVAYAQLNVQTNNPPGGLVAWISGSGI